MQSDQEFVDQDSLDENMDGQEPVFTVQEPSGNKDTEAQEQLLELEDMEPSFDEILDIEEEEELDSEQDGQEDQNEQTGLEEDQDDEHEEEDQLDFEDEQVQSQEYENPSLVEQLEQVKNSLELKRILQFLGISELKDLNLEEFIQKLQEFIFSQDEESQLNLKSQLETLKAKNRVLEVDLEDKGNRIERLNYESNKEISKLKKDLKEFSDKNNELNQLISVEISKNKQKDLELRSTRDTMNSQVEIISKLEGEKRELFALNVKKQEELEVLKENLDNFSGQINSLRQELSMASHELTDVQSSDAKMRSELSMCEQQIGQLKRNNEWLNQELQKTTQEFNDYRRSRGEQISQLQSLFESCSQERSSLEIKSVSLEKKNNELDEKVQNLLEKTEDLMHLGEKQFRSEMLSQKKLTELYEDKMAQNEERVLEFQNLIKDLEGKVEAFAVERSRILSQNEENLKYLQEQISTKNSEIEKLRGELENINQTLPESQQNAQNGLGLLSPSAAAVSRLEKSGKTFTEIYYDYTSLQEQYAKEKRESARAKQMLESIMSELAERAPVYESFRVDLENLRLENEGMLRDLTNAQNKRDQLDQQASDLKVKVSKLENENRVIAQENRDLGRQVQGLLRQIETVGTDFAGIRTLEASSLQRIVDRNDEGVSLDVLGSDSDALISEKLVVFRNIEELQNQNQTLRRTVRNLSKKMEEFENEQSRQRDEQISKEMDDASKAIEALQEQLRVQSLKLDTFVRERDQWKKIAEGRLPSSSPFKDNGSRAPSPGSEVRKGAEIENMYKEIQNEYAIYRKECDTNIKMLKETIDSLNQEKLELSIQSARLMTQSNYQQERYDLLVANTEGQSKELSLLRDKLSTSASTLTRQESKIQELTVNLSESRQTLEIIKNENQQMKIDREVWKATEARTIKERQDLVRERNSTIDRLREVQHQFDDKDRLATAERKRIEGQLELAQKEMQSTRKQLNDIMDEHRSMSARHDIESKEAQSRIETLSTSLEKARGELSLSQNKESNLNERLHEVNARLKAAEEKLSIYEGRARLISQSTESNPEDRVKTLEIKLNQAKYEITTLSEELKMEKEHCIAFKDIAQASEERLSEVNSTYDLYKAETERELDHAKQMISALEMEKEEIKERLNSTIQELTSSQEKLDEQQAQYSQKIKDLEHNLEGAKLSESSALGQFETLRADIQLHSKIARDAQENYEREVMAHSVSLKSLTSAKEELTSLKNQLAESEQKLFVSERSWNSSKASWELLKAEYENQLQELKTRCNDLTVQNTLLHSQFEQIQSAQRKISHKAVSDIMDASSVDNSQEELREVIRFLRREKDILQTKLELSLQEGERSTVQLEHLQKSLDETRATLDEERSRKSDHLIAERKHKELLDKIEQANLLRESNITLRDQLEASKNKQIDLEIQLRNSKEELIPLKVSLSKFEADLNVRNDEIEALHQDNARWKLRTQQILEKYERIDPVEHARLQSENEALRTEINELKKNSDGMMLKLKEVEEKAKKIENISMNYKSSLSDKSIEILEKEGVINKLNEEIKVLKSGSKVEELARATQEIDKLKADRQSLVQRSNENTTKARQKNVDLLNKNKELEKQIVDLQNKIKSFPSSAETAEKQQKEMNELSKNIRAEMDQSWQHKLSSSQRQTEGYKKMALELESKQLQLTEDLLNLRKKYQELYVSQMSEKVEPTTLDQQPSVSGKRPRNSKTVETGDDDSTAKLENSGESGPPSTKRLRIEADPFIPNINPPEPLQIPPIEPTEVDDSNNLIQDDTMELVAKDLEEVAEEESYLELIEENEDDAEPYEGEMENQTFIDDALYAPDVQADEENEALLQFSDDEIQENEQQRVEEDRNASLYFVADQVANDEVLLELDDDEEEVADEKIEDKRLESETGIETTNVDIVKEQEEEFEENPQVEEVLDETQGSAEAVPAEPLTIVTVISKGEPSKRSISPIRPPAVPPAVVCAVPPAVAPGATPDVLPTVAPGAAPDVSPTSNDTIIKPISPILPPATIISPIGAPSGSKVIIQRDAIPEQTLAPPAKPVEMTMQARADLLRQKLLQEKAVKGASGEKSKPRITRNPSGAIIANINRLVSSTPTTTIPTDGTRGGRGGRKPGRGGQRGRGQRGAH